MFSPYSCNPGELNDFKVIFQTVRPKRWKLSRRPWLFLIYLALTTEKYTNISFLPFFVIIIEKNRHYLRKTLYNYNERCDFFVRELIIN